MPFRRRPFAFLLLCLLPLALSSCLARRRLIPRAATTQTLAVSDLTSLLNVIDQQYQAIRDFKATVDMVPALGSAEKNHITEYKDVRAFIRYRRPADIRLIALYPVVRNKAFDMVSNGADFKLYIPSRNRYIVGNNEIRQLSRQQAGKSAAATFSGRPGGTPHRPLGLQSDD